MNRDSIHATVAERLAVFGQRETATRRVLVEVLANAGKPVTIEDIIRSAPTLALSSAYRNLTVLERAQIVHRVVTDEEFARYELTEELTGHHHHLVCASCGAVRDVTMAAKIEGSLDHAIARVAKASGFTAVHHRLDLIGLCADCTRDAATRGGD